MSENGNKDDKPTESHEQPQAESAPDDQQNTAQNPQTEVGDDEKVESTKQETSKQTLEAQVREELLKEEQMQLERDKLKSPSTILRELTESLSGPPPVMLSEVERRLQRRSVLSSAGDNQPEANIEIDINSQDDDERSRLLPKSKEKNAEEQPAANQDPAQPQTQPQNQPRTWRQICFKPEYWFIRASIMLLLFIIIIVVFVVLLPLQPVVHSAFAPQTTCRIEVIESVKCNNEEDDKSYCINGTCIQAGVSFFDLNAQKWLEGFLVPDDANALGNCFTRPDRPYSPCKAPQNTSIIPTTTPTTNNTSDIDFNDDDDDDDINEFVVGCNITCFYQDRYEYNSTDPRIKSQISPLQRQRLGLHKKYTVRQVALMLFILTSLVMIIIMVACCARARRRENNSRMRQYGFEGI